LSLLSILPVNLAWQCRQSVFYHKVGSFCIYKQLKRISILCYGEFMESAILHNTRCLSFYVVINAEGSHLMIKNTLWRHCQARLTGDIKPILFFPKFCFSLFFYILPIIILISMLGRCLTIPFPLNFCSFGRVLVNGSSEEMQILLW